MSSQESLVTEVEDSDVSWTESQMSSGQSQSQSQGEAKKTKLSSNYIVNICALLSLFQ